MQQNIRFIRCDSRGCIYIRDIYTSRSDNTTVNISIELNTRIKRLEITIKTLKESIIKHYNNIHIILL
jgi:hypothetical protein